MSNIILSQFAQHKLDTVNGDCAGDLVVNKFYVDLLTTDLLAGNVIDLGILPAGHTFYGAKLICDDLDTGTAITLDVGIMSGTPGVADNTRTVGQELFAGATAAQAGAVVDTATTKSAYTVVAQPYDQSIGVKIVTAPTGATAGRIRLLVAMYPTKSGVTF